MFLRRLCVLVLFVAATAWAAAIVYAPRVEAREMERRMREREPAMFVQYVGLGILAADMPTLMRLAGSLVCHQRPERSFWYNYVQYPVCARCTGLYVGASFGLSAMLFTRRARAVRQPRDRVYRRWRLILSLAAVPTVVSIVLERLGGPSDVVSRAYAALPLGAAAAAFVAAAILGHFAVPLPGEDRRSTEPGAGV